jgi:hypothetical protein
MTQFGPQQKSMNDIKALSILKAQDQKLVGGISRPDMVTSLKERKLNFNFKISSWNEKIFIGWQPTYADIKSPLDPEVIRARNELILSLI